MIMAMNKLYEVPAISRALDILEYLYKKKEATFTNIYAELGLPKSSAYSILTTLESRGYIRRFAQGGSYGLGLRLFELGNLAASRIDIRKETLPFLMELAIKTNQTCHLGVLDETEGVYMEKVESSRPVIMNSWLGKRLSLHSTSIGKVLLAWQNKQKLEQILNEIVLHRYTSKTIILREELREHLAVVREQGYALDDEENEPEIRCVAGPVFDINGEIIAAISISGLTTQMNLDRLPELIDQVKDTTRSLSRCFKGEIGL
jgi:DNA-binding IclR family transcriptional regulator